MKLITPLALALVVCYSCSNDNNSAQNTQLFCDTACVTDSFKFSGNHKLQPFVSISVQDCEADTITFSHEALPAERKMDMEGLLGRDVRLNKEVINCFIKDTSYAWLAFNDCRTGRGYLMKLPFDKKESISKMTSAINSFDKKFVVPDDLRSYADYSTIYVVDVNTNKTEQMTFKEEYSINWDNIHETIDSVNISRNRIFVVLNKNGEKVNLEKQINL